jgi:hypothetical protein
MATYPQCPLCKADFIEPAKTKLPDELVQKIIWANRKPATVRISEPLDLDGPVVQEITSPDSAEADSWDGKVPLCAECAQYFRELAKYENTGSMKKGWELHFLYLYQKFIEATGYKSGNERGHEGKQVPKCHGRESVGIHRTNELAPTLYVRQPAVAQQVDEIIQRESKDRSLREVLRGIDKKYIAVKVNPYRWHSGKDYWPLVNESSPPQAVEYPGSAAFSQHGSRKKSTHQRDKGDGKVAFSRQVLYEAGITAATMRRLKAIAIEYVQDHLAFLQDFHIAHYREQCERLSQILDLCKGLDDDGKSRLVDINFEYEINRIFNEHKLSEEAWEAYLKKSGWYRRGRRGGRRVEVARNRAVYQVENLLNEALGKYWRSGISIEGTQLSTMKLLGSLLTMMGIQDMGECKGAAGWVTVTQDDISIRSFVRKAREAHQKLLAELK